MPARLPPLLRAAAEGEDVAEAAKRYMTEVYEEFPALTGAQVAVRQVISLLADGRPVIAHCFAGKDRTGFTVATVLEGGTWFPPLTAARSEADAQLAARLAQAGVSAYPPEVTAQMVANITSGGAAVNVLARQSGATVRVVDMSVDADTLVVTNFGDNTVAQIIRRQGFRNHARHRHPQRTGPAGSSSCPA